MRTWASENAVHAPASDTSLKSITVEFNGSVTQPRRSKLDANYVKLARLRPSAGRFRFTSRYSVSYEHPASVIARAFKRAKSRPI